MAKITNRVATSTLIKRTAEKLGLPVTTVKPIVQAFIEEVTEVVSTPTNAWLHPKLGMLYGSTRTAPVRNPKTGEPLGKRVMTTVRFKASKHMIKTGDVE